ncbi:response regulator transcription factor [Halarcobacter ebronensis]|uniref:response regulator transcription factor n=1 Tax=Halarcobacter ebronensis TaxID=1462615 RepID=UPI001E3C68C2|nr:response regulator transcription factor [Halarcobacter ebronensis]QKF81999.1 two-component system response regulator [Halarcobacter ebronensis]
MRENEDLLKDLKILFVEDEVNISKLLKDALGEYFYSFTMANNGEEGLSKFEKIKPDIVITDIMMPKLDGLEMTKKIRQLDENVPIIILSAFSDKEKLLKAIDIGISKYFIKPFDPEEVLNYLSDLAKKIDKNRVLKINENFTFDTNTKNLFENDKLVNITKREKQFLTLLLQNEKEILAPQKIKDELWNEDVSDERLRTFIKRFRIKTSRELVRNITGQGYIISVNNE